MAAAGIGCLQGTISSTVAMAVSHRHIPLQASFATCLYRHCPDSCDCGNFSALPFIKICLELKFDMIHGIVRMLRYVHDACS